MAAANEPRFGGAFFAHLPVPAPQIRGFPGFQANLLKFLKFLLASKNECP